MHVEDRCQGGRFLRKELLHMQLPSESMQFCEGSRVTYSHTFCKFTELSPVQPLNCFSIQKMFDEIKHLPSYALTYITYDVMHSTASFNLYDNKMCFILLQAHCGNVHSNSWFMSDDCNFLLVSLVAVAKLGTNLKKATLYSMFFRSCHTLLKLNKTDQYNGKFLEFAF